MNIKQELFPDVDFAGLRHDSNFKEDSVREIILAPMLAALGYAGESIERSKQLGSQQIGTTKFNTRIVPDYLLKIEDFYAWVLDAKAPSQKITQGPNVEQAYSYAVHYQVRCKFYALCNGVEFALFSTTGDTAPILFFEMEDINDNWATLKRMLSPQSFQVRDDYDAAPSLSKTEFDYEHRELPKEVPIRRQAARRHFGVHGYFTRQAWNVVAAYIKNFTQKGDIVLDPYGGSGVTAIEAIVNGRTAINIDINPLAVFIVDSLIAPVNLNKFSDAYDEVTKIFNKERPKTDAQIERMLSKYKLPPNLPLPKNSDFPFVHDLFTKKQMAELLLLRAIIRRQKESNIQKTLMLMFSGIVTRYNATCYLNTHNGGVAAAMWIYRYRKAREPYKLDIMTIWKNRYRSVFAAKKELNSFAITQAQINDCQNIKGSATSMSFLDKESVDYIYTDPPYGCNIQYLDLSAMWNAWLDCEPSEEDYQLEAIEDGTRGHTFEEYGELITKSLQEMFRVLKWGRWMSFVFAHKDPRYWHLIVDSAERVGFEYVGAQPQRNGGANFHKWQNPFTNLHGQLIINFRKVRNPKTLLLANVGMDMGQIIMQTIEGIIMKENGATIEQINDELIVKGLAYGFLHLLAKEYKDIGSLLRNNFDYDVHEKKYVIRAGAAFKTKLPLEQRIKYYLVSYLRIAAQRRHVPTFDEIVVDIMPRLKNGVPADPQDILGVLNKIAEHIGDNGWRLRDAAQGEMF